MNNFPLLQIFFCQKIIQQFPGKAHYQAATFLASHPFFFVYFCNYAKCVSGSLNCIFQTKYAMRHMIFVGLHSKFLLLCVKDVKTLK